MTEDLILINGIRLMAYCGELPEEKTRRQPFDIDIEMKVDIEKAATSDNLDDTVDYAWVLEEVNKHFADIKIDLIEKMAQMVADIVLSNKQVQEAKITIKKLQSPVSYQMNYTGISITRTNSKD